MTNTECQPMSLEAMKGHLAKATFCHNADKLTGWRRLLRTAIRLAEERDTVSRQLREANLKLQERAEQRVYEPFFLNPHRDWFTGNPDLSAAERESSDMEGTEVAEIDWSKFVLPKMPEKRENFQNMKPGQVWTSVFDYRDHKWDIVYRIRDCIQEKYGAQVSIETLFGNGSNALYLNCPWMNHAVMVSDEHGHWEPGFSAQGIAGNYDFAQLSARKLRLCDRDNTPNIKVGQTWLRCTQFSEKTVWQAVRFVEDLGDRFRLQICRHSGALAIEGDSRVYLKSRLDKTMSAAVLLYDGSSMEPQYHPAAISPQESKAVSSSPAA